MLDYAAETFQVDVGVCQQTEDNGREWIRKRSEERKLEGRKREKSKWSGVEEKGGRRNEDGNGVSRAADFGFENGKVA